MQQKRLYMTFKSGHWEIFSFYLKLNIQDQLQYFKKVKTYGKTTWRKKETLWSIVPVSFQPTHSSNCQPSKWFDLAISAQLRVQLTSAFTNIHEAKELHSGPQSIHRIMKGKNNCCSCKQLCFGGACYAQLDNPNNIHFIN